MRMYDNKFQPTNNCEIVSWQDIPTIHTLQKTKIDNLLGYVETSTNSTTKNESTHI